MLADDDEGGVREPIKLRAGSEPSLSKALCATEHGFSLHAATTASASDAAGREALCKYILRPPLSQERVQLVEGDLVRLVLKRPFSDGTFALELDPLSFLARLATSVPPPRFNTVRYRGRSSDLRARRDLIPGNPSERLDGGAQHFGDALLCDPLEATNVDVRAQRQLFEVELRPGLSQRGVLAHVVG